MFSVAGRGQPEVGHFIHIDEQVMMSGIGKIDSGGGDSHAGEAEFYGKFLVHGFPILGPDEINFGPFGGRGAG